MADCQNRFWPETSARREFELIRLLAEEGTERMRVLWLRKCSRTSSLHQHVPGQPSQRREAAHPQAQQDAGRQPRPAPAQAQAVPKQKTAAQLARRQRSLVRLQQKHISRALARERTARGLRVWCARARLALASQQQQQLAPAGASRLVALDEPADLPPSWPPPGWTMEDLAEMAGTTAAALTAARQPPPPPPALALAAPPPPSQQQPSALAAAARAALDASELQDDRGSKRDATL